MSCEFIPSLQHPDTCKTCGSSFFQHERKTAAKVGRKRALTPQQEAEIVTRYKGRSVSEKAKQLGISTATLYNIVQRHQA